MVQCGGHVKMETETMVAWGEPSGKGGDYGGVWGEGRAIVGRSGGYLGRVIRGWWNITCKATVSML